MSETTTPQLSPQLRKALAEEIARIGDQKQNPPPTPEQAAYDAMRAIVGRVLNGEQNLYDPTNAGDNLALALGAAD